MTRMPAERLSLSALADAESEGAAPGADGRREPGSAARDAPSWCAKRGLVVLAALFAAFGAAGFASAGWLHAKAQLGQWLLAQAWRTTQVAGGPVKPWPWADLHPVARLVVPGQRVDLLVLEGASGRTLAWGPGHDERSASPGDRGNAIVTGHRDTHFAFLRALAVGDAVVLENAFGRHTTYRVRQTRILDHRALRLPMAESTRLLTLVTCYPFDAIAPDTPWRYVVVAEEDDLDADASPDRVTSDGIAAGATSIARSGQAVNASTKGARPNSP
jgi:sortase A